MDGVFSFFFPRPVRGGGVWGESRPTGRGVRGFVSRALVFCAVDSFEGY